MIARFILLWLLALPTALAAAPDKILSDLAYGADTAQRLDVYLPPGPHDAPVLVLMHGGAWRFGDKANDSVWHNKQAHWGARGYIVVSVGTRLLPQADPLEQAQDLARAMAFVQDHAADWGGDEAKIVLMGHSAGAHLAALLSADPGSYGVDGLKPWAATVALDTAALDLERVMAARPPRAYKHAFGSDPALWRAASPQVHLSRRVVPMLLVCSTARRTSCPAAQDFVAAIDKAGGQGLVLPVALRHLPINTQLGKDPAYTASVDGFLRGLGLP